MRQESHDSKHEPEDALSEDAELVPEDDAIIGKAFSWSIAVLAVATVVAALIFLVLRKEEEALPETVIETSAPEVVDREIAAPAVTFTDITTSAGIDFVHVNGATGDKLLPETMGSGVAFFDYDGDGDGDLLFANGRSWSSSATGSPATAALYRNDGRGHFEDVTAEAGLDVSLYGTGVAVGDVDADGRVDLFLAAVGENRLLRNTGGRFEDVTASAGVAGGSETWSSSAGFFDYDGDGDLDLFVCNYVRWSRDIDLELDYQLTGVGRAYGPPVNYEGVHSYLYRNDGVGNDGTGDGAVVFTDISAAAGIEIRNEVTGVPVAKALALAPIDIDRDGAMDVLIANDTVQNFFFHNRGDGTFEEMGEFFGVAYGRAGEATGAMGIDAAYYRNDDTLGFVIGNFANEMSSLYLSQGDPTLYADEAIGEGIGAASRTYLSFGVLFFDFDLDGRLDMLQTNGHLESEIQVVDASQTYEQAPQLFWNAGPDARYTFVEVDGETGDLFRPMVGRASAYADIDGDGDLDVVLSEVGKRPRLLRNDQQLGHHWLRLQLRGKGANRDAIGAWVEVRAAGMTQRRQVMPTRSYQSQSEAVLTFGLGQAAVVEAVKINWPDGSEQALADLAADQLHRIEQP